ncbi:type IV secretory system conjugative DNA transfer family protein, partial [Jeotgalibacillus marinus]
DWQKTGERPLLFLIDEAQEMIGVEDRRFLAVARGHGGACVYATQNIEAYTSRMGMEAAISFMDNFRSKVVMIS